MAQFPFPSGVSLGTTLLQQHGEIGGARGVFVKLRGNKNELVFPTHGGQLMNPFKGKGKIYAGDLVEYRTDANGQNPALYLLKVFEASKASSGSTVNFVNDGYHHIPCVGDKLMIAPATLDATGTGVTVTAVTLDTDGTWKVTTSAAMGSLSKGSLVVEADATGASAKMLVQNPNTFAPNDMEMMYDPAVDANDFDGARYFFAPVLHGIAYTAKMSPVPECVKAVNKSRVNGWFEL